MIARTAASIAGAVAAVERGFAEIDLDVLHRRYFKRKRRESAASGDRAWHVGAAADTRRASMWRAP
jgi:hypothetical protein